MKQDYARTIGYLALLILFIQILPFGPLFGIIATAICCFILIGIAFSISNLYRKETKYIPELDPKVEKELEEKHFFHSEELTSSETKPDDQVIIIQEFLTEDPVPPRYESEQ